MSLSSFARFALFSLFVGERKKTYLLRPHHLGVRVPPQLPAHQVEGERRELLHAHDRDVRRPPRALPFRSQLIEDLPAAEQQALDLGLRRRVGAPVRRAAVHDQPLEPHALNVGVRGLVVELVEVGARGGVPQQVLRAHHDERLAERAVQLAAQQVEVVGRGGHVGDLPVGALDLAAEVAADGPFGVVDVLKCCGSFWSFPPPRKK